MRRRFALGLAFVVLALSRPAAQTEPRQRRQSPPQHQVERSIAYFVGRWRVEYVGGEFPPLGAGSRSGTVTLSQLGASNFAAGPFDGELLGKPYTETHVIGFDPDTNALVMHERRADGFELVSLGQWRSPLAMTFQTAPVKATGRTFQLRRVISVTSDVAFEVTEEFSVDGGAFRRLGNGHYTKQP